VTTYRLCNAAACDYRTEVNDIDPDVAWDTVTDHYKDTHGMTGSDAAHFGARHSTTRKDAR
jgi:hypothetical protein